MLSVSQPFVEMIAQFFLVRPFTHFSSHSSEGKSQSSRMITLVVSCCSFCCASFCLNLKDIVFALWLGGSCWEDMAGVEMSGGRGDGTEMVEAEEMERSGVEAEEMERSWVEAEETIWLE